MTANQAKDHFLSIASHDLKVPIAGILGLIGLMKAEKSERSESDMEYLTYMEDSCNNMQRLISNLLDINRIEQGRNSYQKASCRCRNYSKKLKTNLLNRPKEADQIILRQWKEHVYTDPDALQQILENLVSNAIKFSPPSKIIQLSAMRNNNQIRFEIIDQGRVYLPKKFRICSENSKSFPTNLPEEKVRPD